MPAVVCMMCVMHMGRHTLLDHMHVAMCCVGGVRKVHASTQMHTPATTHITCCPLDVLTVNLWELTRFLVQKHDAPSSVPHASAEMLATHSTPMTLCKPVTARDDVIVASHGFIPDVHLRLHLLTHLHSHPRFHLHASVRLQKQHQTGPVQACQHCQGAKP